MVFTTRWFIERTHKRAYRQMVGKLPRRPSTLSLYRQEKLIRAEHLRRLGNVA